MIPLSTTETGTKRPAAFRYKGVLIQEQTPFTQLYQVAQGLNVQNAKSKTSAQLCQSIYGVLKSTEQLYNPTYVQEVSSGSAPLEHSTSTTMLSYTSVQEAQKAAPEDDDEPVENAFVFPASVLDSTGLSRKSLSEKQRKEYAAYIRKIRKALLESPDLQVAGAFDPTGAKSPDASRSAESVNDCDDKDMAMDAKERRERYRLEDEKRARNAAAGKFGRLTAASKWQKLVQICASGTSKNFADLPAVLRSLALERWDLNKPISEAVARTVKGVKETSALVGLTPLMAIIRTVNLFSERNEPYRIARMLLSAHSLYSSSFFEIDLNRTVTQGENKGDTALILLFRRCARIPQDAAALRLYNSDPKTPLEQKVSESDIAAAVRRAKLALHDIVSLILKPKEHLLGAVDITPEFHLRLNVNKDNNGVSPYWLAANSGCMDCFNMLHDQADALDASTQDLETGLTVLAAAVRKDSPLMVMKTLETKTNLRARSATSSTVFHEAARHGWSTGYIRYPDQKEKVANLWNQSHPEDLRDASNPPTIMEMLYDALRYNIEGYQRQTAQDRKKIAARIASDTGEAGQDLELNEMMKRMKISQTIIDAQDDESLTALMISALKRDPEAVAFLLSINADPSIKHSKVKGTALQLLEYDVIPELHPEKQKDRDTVRRLLRKAEEADARRKKAARLRSNDALLGGVTIANSSNVPSETLKELDQKVELRPYRTQIVELYNDLKAIRDKYGAGEALQRIRKIYFTPYVNTERVLLRQLGVGGEDTAGDAERYRLAEKAGPEVMTFNDHLSKLESTIRKANRENGKTVVDSIYHLYRFIDVYMIPKAFQ